MKKDALTAFLESLQPLRLEALPDQLKRGRQHVVWKPELRRDQKIGTTGVLSEEARQGDARHALCSSRK